MLGPKGIPLPKPEASHQTVRGEQQVNVTEAQTQQLQAHCAEAFELWYRADPDLGTQSYHVADATVFLWPGLPIPLFNRAIGLGDEHQPDDAEIDRVLDLYREAGIEGYIQLSPLA